MNLAVQYKALIDRYEGLVRTLRQVYRLLASVVDDSSSEDEAAPESNSALRQALRLLRDVVDDTSSEDDAPESGSSGLVAGVDIGGESVERPDAAVEAIADLGRSLLQQMRQPVLPPGVQTVQAFRGCIYRLD